MLKRTVILAAALAVGLSGAAFAQGGGNSDATVSKGETGATKAAAPNATKTKKASKKKKNGSDG